MPARTKTHRTTLSTKGQIILPKAVRDSKGWNAGMKLVAEETRDGVMLRADRVLFAPTRYEDVFGSLHYDGPAIAIEDMAYGVVADNRRTHDRD